MSVVEVIKKCDLCGSKVAGDNSESWAGKLPLPSAIPTAEELEKNPDLAKRPEYSIASVDVCFPCMTRLGDWLKEQAKK